MKRKPFLKRWLSPRIDALRARWYGLRSWVKRCPGCHLCGGDIPRCSKKCEICPL